MPNLIKEALESYQSDVSLEEMSLDERLKDSSFLKKISLKLLSKLGVMPKLTFDETDIDLEIVEKLLKHKKALQFIDEWIWEPYQEFSSDFDKYKNLINSITNAPHVPYYYRGFDIKGEQNYMGLGEIKKFLFIKYQSKKDFKVGDTFTITTDKLTSFTYFEPTANDFGKIVIKVKGRELYSRALHITPNVIYALQKMSGYEKSKTGFFSHYGESVFVPDGKPITFQIHSIK